MSKADAALLDRIRDTTRPLILDDRLPEAVQAAAATVTGSADLLAAMKALAALVILADDALTAADATKKAVRATMLAAMDETGAPALRLEHHTISTSSGARTVAVTDPAQLPPDLWKQPPPVPDMDAIRARWKAHQPVPGTDRRNGAPYLSVQARSE